MINCKNSLYSPLVNWLFYRYREKYGFYAKYLRVLDTIADPKANQDNAEDIKTILKTALNYFPYEIDISTFLDLKPVQEISKVDKDLYDLFVCAVEGNLANFEQWKQSRATYLSTNSIFLEIKKF